MQPKLAEADLMTIEEFLAFTDSRPDGESWELIEGIAVMSPSPTQWHQTICKNLLYRLEHIKQTTDVAWHPMPGVGTIVPISPKSLPRPDVFIQAGEPVDSHVTDDAIVIFEVLSRSNRAKDRAWRKRVYGSVPNCQHYVTIAMRTAEVVRHDRLHQWKGETLKGLDTDLRLEAVGLALPLRQIYLWTPIR